MKRLPEESMLDYLIRHNEVTDDQLRRAAALLAEFYKTLPGIITTPGSHREKLRGEIYTMYRELTDPAFHLPPALIGKLISGLLRFLNDRASLLDERVVSGSIKEIHGDLRPEHICLVPEPAIIDCLEFNRDLRIQDTAEELSFLAMECEMMGNSSVGKIFFGTYTSLTSDKIAEPLINFYKLRKACLRAFLVIRHIAEPAYREDPKWIAAANAYLRMAEKYNAQLALS
jgi:aminoglycoside phosphotransferase family enzyme